MRVLSALSFLAGAACGPPKQEGSDQFVDLNLIYTADKDRPLEGGRPAVDAIVTTWMAQHPTAGCGVAITQGGHLAFVQGYGVANAATNEPFDIDTMAPVGSISKTVTALAVMRLWDAGYVDLDDHIDDWLSQVDASWAGMTIRHALSHQSGLPKWPNDVPNHGETQADIEADHPTIERPTLFPFLVYPYWADTATVNTPGTATAYSNIGVEAVGAIVDLVSLLATDAFPGQAGYERFAWHTVARPTGDWFDHDNMLTPVTAAPWRMGDMPNRSVGHTLVNGAFVPIADEWDVWWPGGAGGASGAWMMTPGDLGRLTLAFRRDGRVISQAAHDEMTLWHSNALGPYGLGVATGSIAGRPAFSHPGNADGHDALMIYWPNEDVGVGVVCNSVTGAIGQLAVDVANTVLNGGTTAHPDPGLVDQSYDDLFRMPITEIELWARELSVDRFVTREQWADWAEVSRDRVLTRAEADAWIAAAEAEEFDRSLLQAREVLAVAP